MNSSTTRRRVWNLRMPSCEMYLASDMFCGGLRECYHFDSGTLSCVSELAIDFLVCKMLSVWKS